MSTKSFVPLDPPRPPKKNIVVTNRPITRWTKYGRLLTRLGYLFVVFLGGMLVIIGIGGVIWALWLALHGYNPWEAYAVGVTCCILFAGLWQWKGEEL